MNINRLKFLMSASLMLVLPSSFAMAQYKVNAEKPEIVTLISPQLGEQSAKDKKFTGKDWMEIEIKFKVEVPPADKKKVKFLDKVTLKWYVAVKNPDGGSGFVLLEKEVNHVNVPVDEEIYASVYLSPNSIKRMTGGDRVNKADVKEVGGEISVNGQEAYNNSGFFSLSTQGKWWTSGKLARYDKIPLLNKDETPFKILWYDRYAEIEQEK
jgi:hypothetical protein